MSLFSATSFRFMATPDLSPQPIVLPAAANPAWSSALTRTPVLPAPSVAELSARLLPAYTLDGGTLRLAGCTLEPRAVLRVTGSIENEDNPREHFFSADGESLDDALVQDLGLRRLAVCEKPPRLTTAEYDRLIAIGHRAIDDACRAADLPLHGESVRVEVVWVRWAAGKLRFSFGNLQTELPFANWAARLTPPAFVCPYSQRETFHLAATDDEKIAAAEAIASCNITGRRLLANDLLTCSITGKRVTADLAEVCPITEQPVMKELLVDCPLCGLKVSPQALDGERCAACRAANAVAKADPRMCLVLGEHPGLDRWHRWQLAETPESYVLEARGVLKRLLVVVEKQSLQVTRLAEGNRFQTGWTDVAAAGWNELLR